ncbi:MAG: hypothetical protein UT84_C0003G0023 [Candidatus Curtissbacteria bacterium GW2011_GWA1_40_16]|uniref:DUF8173 domain-containing protein n=1 Tax=Candidatus Curtissbacteria bacterium GW2011_GWA1_40_16 TaxID=1618405 RepID=A0A0G0RF01_9BACT|nr:MAG: hypothetical protein UT84_C0003G0023 [Candidatus Curtissbacteria bacterium GW2011_GWA1_40_16]
MVIEGEVGRNVSVAGGNVTLDKSAQIAGNAAIAGGNVDVLSQIKDLSVAGGNVKIESTVLGNLTAGAGTLTILGDSRVSGNLEYWSVEKATIAPSVQIAGKTTFHQTEETNTKRQEAARRFFAAIGMFFTVISFISSLVVGLLLIWLMPVYTQKTVDIIRSKFWLSLLLGFVTLIVVPVAVLILLITLVGIPIGLILLFGYFVILYLSKLFVVLVFGKYIAGRAHWKLNSYWVFIASLAAYYLVGFIPVIGPLMKLIVLFVGVGAIVISKKYYFTTFRSKKLL